MLRNERYTFPLKQIKPSVADMETMCFLRTRNWIITYFKDYPKIQRLRQHPYSKCLKFVQIFIPKLDLPVNPRTTMGRPGNGWEMIYATRHTSIVTIQGPLAVFTMGAVHPRPTPPPPSPAILFLLIGQLEYLHLPHLARQFSNT